MNRKLLSFRKDMGCIGNEGLCHPLREIKEFTLMIDWIFYMKIWKNFNHFCVTRRRGNVKNYEKDCDVIYVNVT